MRNTFRKAIIDDAFPHNIHDALQANLLDLFEYAMKSVATTLIRGARFDTTEFAAAKGRNCEGFTLFVYRTRTDLRKAWFGAFQQGEQRMEVIGHLE